MNLKEIEKVVASIRSNLFKSSNSYAVGMLKSNFKGAGLQFKEHQIYAPGDDVRFIDWKLSAKTNTTYVKTFEEERNIEIYTVLDVSESMLIGYNNISKLQASVELICLMYLLVEKTKDKVAPIIFAEKAHILPLASGYAGITLFMSQLEKIGILNSSGKVNLGFRLAEEVEEKKKIMLLKSFVAKGKEVVFLTDFNTYSDYKDLNKLFYHRNLHCMKMESPLESQSKLPFWVYGQKKQKKALSKEFLSNNQLNPKGRYKRINVKDRYLEKFVREML